MNSTVYIHKKHLLGNISAIKSRLKTSVKSMAVIKDNGYGHGFDGVAKCLEPEVDWFCVARAEEGVRMRDIGIQKPILVFENPNTYTVEYYPKFKLTATVADLNSFELLKSGTEFHINIDTGMRRLGILPNEVPEMIQKIESRKDVLATGIYTHFSKADDPGNSEVEEQLNLFNTLRQKFDSSLMTHTANTGAIFHYPNLDLQFDAVRPGVSLFGYGAGDAIIKELSPVIDWKSYLMQIKPIKKGESVSYGGRWIAPFDGYIGVIPVGYSSGIHRVLSSKIEYEIEGNLYPQVGTISMDYSMVFLGKNQFETGTEITLLNPKELNAKNWADKAGTIPYEITT
ncbi:MAG: alanine racemase, partial [Balneolaceae bacterium]